MITVYTMHPNVYTNVNIDGDIITVYKTNKYISYPTS